MNTIKRAAQPGDKILITNCDDHRYTDGDIFTVDSVDRDGDVTIEGEGWLVLAAEFEIIIEEAPALFAVGDRVEGIGGFHVGEVGTVIEFKKDSGSWLYNVQFASETWWKFQHTLKAAAPAPTTAPDEFKVGDRIRKTSGTCVGEIGTVIEVRPPGYIDADRGLRYKVYGSGELAWAYIHNCEKIEVVPAPKFKAGDKVRSKKFGEIYTLAERDPQNDKYGHGIAWNCVGGGWIGEDQVETVTPVQTFPNGSKVILIAGGNDFPLFGFKNGEEYEVKAQPGEYRHAQRHATDGRIQIQRPGGLGYALPSQLKMAPVIEATTIDQSHITVGNPAQTFEPGARIYSTDGTKAGKYGTIIRRDGSDGWRVKFDDGSTEFKLTHRMKLAPEVEAAPQPAVPTFEVGDHIKGIDSDRYAITTDAMTRGEVLEFKSNGTLFIKVLEHVAMKEEVGSTYNVDPQYFAKIDKPAPTPKYKIGDKLKGLITGNIYTVEDIKIVGKEIRYVHKPGEGSGSYAPEHQVELYEAPKPQFKKGDRVRTKSDGREFILADRKPELDGIFGTAFGLVGLRTWLGADQIELVEEAPVPASKFNVGDRVVVIGNGSDSIGTGSGCRHHLEHGTIGKVVGFARSGRPKVAPGSDGYLQVVDPADLELAPEVKQDPAPEVTAIAIGDYIQSTEGTRKGEFGTVLRSSGSGYVVEFEDGGKAYKSKDRMKLATKTKFQIGDRVILTASGYTPGAIGTIDEIGTKFAESGQGYFIKADNPAHASRKDGRIFDLEDDIVKICE